MASPLQRVRARQLAQRAATMAAGPAAVRTGAAASEYQLQLARLGVDLRRLKEIQSIERKIDLKRQLLPEYTAWVAGVLEADTGAPDEILTHAMIWMIDMDAVRGAMPLVRYVLRHKLSLPERFDRTAPTYICEEIAESALKRLGQGEPPDSDDLAGMIALLEEIDDLVADEDIFDQVRAKLEKAFGLACAIAAEAIPPDADGAAGAHNAGLARTHRHLFRALELDSKAGVKKRLDQIGRALAKIPEEQPRETA